MKNTYFFQKNFILIKVLLGVGVFFFSLIACGPGECYGELILSGNQDWKADITITFSPELTAQESGIVQKIQKTLQEQVQPHRVAYNLSRRLERNASFTYTITLQGNEGLDQFKKVVYVTADPTIPLTDGPVALELIGRVKKGESIPVILESNPSAGFIWELTNADAQKVLQQGEAVFESKSDLLGAAMTQIIYLEGLEEGETSVLFTYRRPWLGDQVPKRKTTIRVPEIVLAADLGNPNPSLMRPVALFSTTPEEEIASGSLQLAASFDWRNVNGQNYVSPVKNQGSCGSCWAFGTVAPLEAKLLISGGGLADLSEQYLVSCNNSGWSCSGGWWAHDYHYNKKVSGELEAGSVLESNFPYTASSSACNPPHAHYQKIESWKYVGSSFGVPSVEAIKNAIATSGPVAAAVCVGSAFSSYHSGIFSTDEKNVCKTGQVNHAVVLVGWDDASDTWIMKNSWGTGWGESGYMRIKRSVSNIGYAANYVVYASSPPPLPPTPTPSPSQTTTTHYVYLPVVLNNNNGPCQQTVCNGDFENGSDGSWSIYSSNSLADFVIVNLSDYDISNHNGIYAAWLGGDPAEKTTITQPITVPGDATHLDYWYWIDSNDSCAKSKGTVYLDTTPLMEYDLCKVTLDWKNEQIPIPANFRGKTLNLIFKAEIAPDPDGIFTSSLMLDDVSILGTLSPLSLKGPGQTPKTRMPFPPGLRKSNWRSAEKGQSGLPPKNR
jgi:C1A family cysteine protease/predicted secreted protein